MKKILLTFCLIFTISITTNANSDDNNKELNLITNLSSLDLSDDFNLETEIRNHIDANFEYSSIEEYNIVCTLVASIVGDVLEEYTDLSAEAISAVKTAIKKVCNELME